MQRLISILAAILFTLSGFAQAPGGISYQAVIRNSIEQLITNQAIKYFAGIVKWKCSLC